MTVDESYKERAKVKFIEWVKETKMSFAYIGPVSKMIEVNGIEYRCKGEVVMAGKEVSITSIHIEREDDEDMWAIKLAMGRCREYAKRISRGDPHPKDETSVREYWSGFLIGMASRMELCSHIRPGEQMAEMIEVNSEFTEAITRCSIPSVKSYLRDIKDTVGNHIDELSMITGIGQVTFMNELQKL